MRTRSIAAAGLVVLMVFGACTRRERPEPKLKRFLLATERESREFVYEEQTPGESKVKVTGTIQDDLRFRAVLSIDGVDVMEQVIIDDALAVRVIDPSKVPEVEEAATVAGSQVIADSLRSGKWVVDYQAAPPLLAPVTREGALAVGDNVILDAYYAIQYIRQAIEDGRRVWEFNPNDLTEYSARDDLFDKPNESLRLERMDVLPPILPRASQRGTPGALPTTAHFRRMAFYVQDGKVLKVVELIDFQSHPEIRRAREGTGSKYPLEVLEAVLAGGTRGPISLRSMSYEVLNVGQKLEITIPLENVLTASLGGLFGPQGLGRASAGEQSGDEQPQPGPDTGSSPGGSPAP